MVKKIREQRRLALRAYELWSEVTALENVRAHAEKVTRQVILELCDPGRLHVAMIAISPPASHCRSGRKSVNQL